MNTRPFVIGVSLIGAALLAAQGFAGGSATGNRLLKALAEADEVKAAQLVDQHADLNAHDDTGATPLMWAAQRGNLELTMRMLKAGADPNLRDSEDLGPLQVAIGVRATEVALQLIAHGADAKAVRDSGETVLMTAARTGQLDVMKQLIARGADVNAYENEFHQTALMWAAGHPEEVKLLIDHRADIHAHSKVWEVTSTIYTPRARPHDATPGLHEGEYVSEKGGQNALFFAVQQDDLESAKALVAAGIDVDERAADGSTALLLAVYKWNSGPGGRCDMHDYPVSFRPNVAIANLLLDRGAAPALANFAGYTPLHGVALGFVPPAQLNQFCRIPSIRVEGANDTRKTSVDPQEGLSLVKRMLDLKADPNAVTRYPIAGPVGHVHLDFEHVGSTPVHVAASAGNADLMKLLLEHGGNPNEIRNDGHSPLSLAAQADYLPLVELLVANGGDVKHTYDPADPIVDVFYDSAVQVTHLGRNETLLHIAAAAGAHAVVPFLVGRGVSLTAKNDKGETALALAESQERIRYQRDRRDAKLQRSFENPNIRDPDGIVLESNTSDAIRRLMHMETPAVRSAKVSISPRS